MEFNFFANPHVQFGPEKLVQFPDMVRGFGNTLLLITGAESFLKSYHWPLLLKGLGTKSMMGRSSLLLRFPQPQAQAVKPQKMQ